jgi:co-chaperonin GroES (HSP10)
VNDSGIIPVRYTCVVRLDEQDGKIGSLYVPASVQDKDKLSAQEGTLVAVSPHAFTYADWQADMRKPEVGDRVLFKRHQGFIHEHGGKSFRILTDEDVIAIVEPEAAEQKEAA